VSDAVRDLEREKLLGQLEELSRQAEDRASERRTLRIVELKQSLWDALESGRIDRARDCLADWKRLDPTAGEDHRHYEELIERRSKVLDLRTRLEEALDEGNALQAEEHLDRWRELSPYDELRSYQRRVAEIRNRRTAHGEGAPAGRERKPAPDEESRHPEEVAPEDPEKNGTFWAEWLKRGWQRWGTLTSVLVALLALGVSCGSFAVSLRADSSVRTPTEESPVATADSPEPTDAVPLASTPTRSSTLTATPADEQPSPETRVFPSTDFGALAVNLGTESSGGAVVGQAVTFTVTITSSKEQQIGDSFGLRFDLESESPPDIPVARVSPVGRDELALARAMPSVFQLATTLDRQLEGTYSVELVSYDPEGEEHSLAPLDHLTITLPENADPHYHEGCSLELSESVPKEPAEVDEIAFNVTVGYTDSLPYFKERMKVRTCRLNDGSVEDFSIVDAYPSEDQSQTTLLSQAKRLPAGEYVAWVLHDYSHNHQEGQYWGRVKSIGDSWHETGFTVHE